MEALGRLAGGIAHDFNNLLTVINLSARLMEKGLHSEDPLWEHIQQISNTSQRAGALTQQLLRFSRREIVRTQALDLNAIIDGLSPMLQRLMGETIRLETALAEPLWYVQADPSQVEQVIVNLAVNARDAMPQGGMLTIKTSNLSLDPDAEQLQPGDEPVEYVLLTMSDTGIGMDDEVKSQVFEPFFTTKERGRGTGLGLASVFGIITQAGGQIQVDSTPGQGSTFDLYWPRCQAQPADRARDVRPSSLIASELPSEAGAAYSSKVLLLVEDETSVRELAARVLESHGYRVLTAGDALQALQIGKEQEPALDLLITDMVLPQMSGPELAERLLPLQPSMRVIYMSGYADDAIRHHDALEPGTAFLTKPFTIEELAGLVRETLAVPQTAAEAEG
jgi:CheY-like chemotaxis protein